MGERLAFTRLVHSDWSVEARKRWTAVAVRSESGWHVQGIEQTPPSADFLNFLFDATYSTLAGFDFVIGLPSFYIDRIVSAFPEQFSFLDLLAVLATERWRDFTMVATRADEIALTRPFYPHHPTGGVRRWHLTDALGCDDFTALLRQCERATPLRGDAGVLFWTVGPKQVGKAALSGWREVLAPAKDRKVFFWPFDGPLTSLHGLAIAETYPAESYGHVGINFRRGMSKRSQADRRKAMAGMAEWCNHKQITLSQTIRAEIAGGFGSEQAGEDPFDAFAGLIAMIEVADGRRAAAPDANVSIQKREGWILGQTELPAQTWRSASLSELLFDIRQ